MRTKIIAGNLIAVLLLGLGSYMVVKAAVERSFTDEVDGRIGDDFLLLDRSVRLSARELVGLVEEQASERAAREVFGALDENGRRARASEHADRVANWLADPARGRGGPPALVAITDDAGRVVARNLNPNLMNGEDISRAVPSVRTAIAGTATADVWRKEDENLILQIAVAPIRSAEGRVVGVLLVGYDLSNGMAVTEADMLGRDVAFVTADHIYSSSLGDRSDALGAYLFGEGATLTTAARDARATSGSFLVDIAGSQYVGVVGPLASVTSSHIAMVVLADRSAQLAKASPVNYVLIFMVVCLILVLAYGFILGGTFLKPIEQMEESILAIINGRTDQRIQIESAEYGGLAYRINQLLNVFTGTQELDESGRVSQPPGGAEWRGDESGQAIEKPPAAAAAPAAGGGDDGETLDDPELAARLAAEPEDAYFTRVFNEYVAAKAAAGEAMNVPQDKFVAKLKSNEQALLKKHGCRMVRFQVQTRGTAVNLKPVVIR